MQIVLVTETLSTGGAETFVLRLAAALLAAGNQVSVFVLRGEHINKAMARSLFSEGRLVAVRVPLLALLSKVNGFLFHIRAGFSLLRWLQVRQLSRFLATVRPDIVHAHLLTADLVSARACAELGIPWVSTMHGDYLAMEAKGGSRAARIPEFQAACREVAETVGQMVCITDQQVHQLRRLMPTLASAGRISKIYNGYTAPKVHLDPADQPDAMKQIPRGDFVIGMVARGVKDKGWDVLIGAFEKLDWPDAWLVLVGDGGHLQKLRAVNRHPRIIFCGNVVDPLRYIARFDVACLPSQFATESLPTVVIEYMYLGKPVIVTHVGEIPKMLDAASDAPAGLLIEQGEAHAMADQIKAALLKLYSDKAECCRLGANAAHAVKKFDMDVCVSAYLDIYAKAVALQ